MCILGVPSLGVEAFARAFFLSLLPLLWDAATRGSVSRTGESGGRLRLGRSWWEEEDEDDDDEDMTVWEMYQPRIPRRHGNCCVLVVTNAIEII